MPAHTTIKSKKNTEHVQVVPDPSLMLKLGRQGYSLPEMLAEFIDNSIDARTGDSVEVEVTIDAKRVVIEDNGRGMDKATLIKALTIAHSNKKDALGEYGLGMKAAAVALGNAFVIETTQADAPEGYRVGWTAASWTEKGVWAYDIETRKAPKGVHGTSITLMDLRFKPVQRVGIVKNELGRRFGPFIRAGELVLKVNGTRCRAPEPDLLPATAIQTEALAKQLPKKGKALQEFSLKTQSGKTIHGWVGLMANSSQKGLYGFDTFRRGRLITYNDKFGFSAHPTVARVCGEVHMDHLPVTSNKREWVKTDPTYEDAEETLKAFIQPWLAESRRLATTTHNLKPVEMARLQDYKAGIAEAFQSKEMRDYALPIGGTPGTPGPGSRLQDVAVEERDERSDKGKEHDGDTEQSDPAGQTRTPNKTDPNRTKRLRVGGKAFDYEHRFGNLGANAAWAQHDWDSSTRHLLVVSNLDSPVFLASKDTAVLAFLHVVDAVANVVVQEVGGDLARFEEVRQILIREASKHVAQL
jgi:hypothetical protein